jgi:conjugal transfer pilus assembly protein TraW
MKKLLLFLIPSLLFSATLVKTYEIGITFEFAEKNMLEEIKNHIKNNESHIEDKLKEYKKIAEEKVKNYKPDNLKKLTPATKANTFYPDMTYTNPNNIYDNEGRVIYPKGFKFNPLDFQILPYQMIVINGTSNKEVEWLINNNYTNNIKYKILLSDGDYKEIEKKLKQDVFYAIPKITDKFNLEHTPSVITQIGNKIEVKEVCISCKKDEK